MALILAVKPGQRQRQIEVITPRTISDRQRRITGQMSAGRSAGLITTIRTIAVVIINGGKGDFDSRVRNAGKCVGVLVELRD